jgi:hypothetical protein
MGLLLFLQSRVMLVSGSREALAKSTRIQVFLSPTGDMLDLIRFCFNKFEVYSMYSLKMVGNLYEVFEFITGHFFKLYRLICTLMVVRPTCLQALCDLSSRSL